MYLTSNKINYIFSHLQHHWVSDKQIVDSFVFVEQNKDISNKLNGRIIFRLSEEQRPEPSFKCFKGEDLPVLFPLSDDESLYKMDEFGNLWFSHDYLSSVFYLLSGMQELGDFKGDELSRFCFTNSLQYAYNFVSKPIVNYYFEVLLNGFETYAKYHKLEIKRRRLFDNFGFILSHDVDRVAFHHPRLIAYKILQILGIRYTNYSKTTILKEVLYGLFFHINPFRGNDPWWSFSWIIELEKRLGIRSTFYFLHREDGYKNAWFKFNSRKIKTLISRLKADKFEVGVHGTFKSATDLSSLIKQKSILASVYGREPVGVRQHYLLFSYPLTFRIQEDAGFVYDSTLAFHDRDGYRNGYCHPFHPYDLERDCAMDIWEIPLVMMEVSVLQYRKLSYEEMHNAVKHYIIEAQKFGGIFSLLWHNCRLNDFEYSGITKFYEELLCDIIQKNPEIHTGESLIGKTNLFLDFFD